MTHQKRTYLIVGLGRFGMSLCQRLVALGQRVVAVDQDPSKVSELADLVDYSVQLDATDEDALIKAGAKEADVAVVTIGENISASILATTIIKGLGIEKVVARAQTSIHARVLARVGAHRVIFPERDMGSRVAEQFVYPWLSQFSQLPGNGYIVGELKPLQEMIGKTLQDLNFREVYGATVLLVGRGEKKILPEPGSVIEENDRLMIVGEKQRLRPWIEEINDESFGGI